MAEGPACPTEASFEAKTVALGSSRPAGEQQKKLVFRGFPGGAVVKNRPIDAGNT